MRERLKKIGINAFKSSIKKIPEIKELFEGELIDLVILTGSLPQGNSDVESDLDLFLILPLMVQINHDLKTEYSFVFEYEQQEYQVEISFVTTEKLVSDQKTKNNIFWWNKSICIYKKTDEMRLILQNAAEYNEEEIKDKLWTLNFQFKLNQIQLSKFSERFPNDFLNQYLIFNDSLKIYLEFVLLTENIIKYFKWYSQELKKQDREDFKRLNNQENFSPNNIEIRKKILDDCSKIIDRKLLKFGFTKKQIKNWNSYGLTRLIFQKY